jgi:CheY-like chemotaxis protein
MLEKLGLEVTIAADGLEAVGKVGNESFDMIFMDIQMPNMNGYEATRRIREEGVSVPIVAITANAMSGDDHKCLDAGCDDYMSKPIRRERLAEIIGKYLQPDDQDSLLITDSAKS